MKLSALEGARIFVVDDEEMLAWSIDQELTKMGAEVMRVSNLKDAIHHFPSFAADVAITDLSLPDGNGIELLKKWKIEYPQIPNILITAHPAVDSAITALRMGAFDYLKKPFKMADLVSAVQRASEISQLRDKVNKLTGEAKAADSVNIIGSSPETRAMVDRLKKVAASRVDTIMVFGESGSGKELAARTLHVGSKDSAKPFVEINCASIPETLLESELFGYEKGAFTDARERKLGLFEIARGGTIFLDEIGELPMKLQAKLLRVLEYRRFKRLGGVKDIVFSARIVAATNRNLAERVADGEFRADLYYRLNVVDIDIPPLRERMEDVQELTETFLDELSKKLQVARPQVAASTWDHLCSHSWPGNIRELKNLIQKALVIHEPKILGPEHLKFHAIPQRSSQTAPTSKPLLTPEQEALRAFPLPKGGISLENVERDFLEQALEKAGQNQTRAAQLLGISRHTLRYRLEKYGIGTGTGGQ